MSDETDKKIPSKRGRKPKVNKEIIEEKKPKKRGRKPKNNIIVNDNPEFEGNHNEDITVKLNETKIEPINNINAYKKEKLVYEGIEKSGIAKPSLICWNCSKKLYKIYEMPIKIVNNVFYTYGDFCSNECCLRFAYENYSDYKYYEIQSLLNYRNKINNIEEIIELPPSKFLLHTYGGPLSNEEYVKSENKYEVDLTNSIHINNIFLKNDNKLKNTNELSSDLKIYRKSDLFKSDINKLLNLD
tara:strand:+ start:1891 stop:2619 length:729 start_codon:yes stop_codon:yes gene_type:complete